MYWGVSSDAQLINFAVEIKHPVQLIHQGSFRHDVDSFEKLTNCLELAKHYKCPFGQRTMGGCQTIFWFERESMKWI